MASSTLVKPAERQRLEAAIAAAERLTAGEIRVHVQARCSEDPCVDAARVFERLGMTRTAARNGVLIFLASETRRFAVIGDTAIHERVGEAFWSVTVSAMTPLFASGDLVGALEAGIRATGEALGRHFPRQENDVNELPDTISES